GVHAPRPARRGAPRRARHRPPARGGDRGGAARPVRTLGAASRRGRRHRPGRRPSRPPRGGGARRHGEDAGDPPAPRRRRGSARGVRVPRTAALRRAARPPVRARPGGPRSRGGGPRAARGGRPPPRRAASGEDGQRPHRRLADLAVHAAGPRHPGARPRATAVRRLAVPRAEAPDVSVLMVTFNAWEWTERALAALVEHTDPFYELIVTDNASENGTLDRPEFRFRRDVDYASAACLLVRRSAFVDAGGFDPAFAPAYYEDVDLCLRWWSQGLRVVCQPGSNVSHAGGASTDRHRIASLLA